jgi:hypothetical protein
MATIKNEIDKILQIASPRILQVSLPPNISINTDNTTGSDIPFYTNGPPTNNPVPTGITIVQNNNGSSDVTLSWTYAQGAIKADGIGIAYRGDHSTVVISDPHVTFGPDTTSYTFRGVDLKGSYRAGIAAYRLTIDGYEVGPIIQPISSPDWRVSPPATNDFEVIIANAAVKQIADASVGAGTHTFDLELGSAQKITATGSFTLAFANVPSGYFSSVVIYAVNWGAYTITLPTYKKIGGTALTFTASGMDRLIVEFDKDGVLSMYSAKDIK